MSKIIKDGHLSIIEHNMYVFYITGVSRACYDRKTEVYTKEGWKFFEDITDDDKFLTRKNNGETVFQKATRFIKYKYEGPMHKYKSQNFDLVVTPNHNLLARRYDLKKDESRIFKLIKSSELPQKRMVFCKRIRYRNQLSDEFTIKGYTYIRKSNQGRDYTVSVPDLVVDRAVFFRFLAWYLSEGCTYYNPKENSYKITISQSTTHPAYRREIEEIIIRLGFLPTRLKTGFTFKSLVLGEYLKKLGKSYEKYIPFDIFEEFNMEYARIFLETYLKGDGTIESNEHIRYYTTSRKIANQIQMLCFVAGYSASIWTDNRIGLKRRIGELTFHNKRVCYVISVSRGKRNQKPVFKKDKHFSEIPYNNYVYCVEVPEHHTLFVRRNGLAIWCGNCSHQLVRKRIASFSQQSQRYVNAENFVYIVPDEIKKSKYGEEYEDLIKQSHLLYQKMIQEGIEKEDARYILPNATSTQLIVSMNAHALVDFFAVRICKRSQWEIRELAERMLEEVRKVSPTIFRNAGAFCDFYGYCPENDKSCGKAATIEELKENKKD